MDVLNLSIKVDASELKQAIEMVGQLNKLLTETSHLTQSLKTVLSCENKNNDRHGTTHLCFGELNEE